MKNQRGFFQSLGAFSSRHVVRLRRQILKREKGERWKRFGGVAFYHADEGSKDVDEKIMRKKTHISFCFGEDFLKAISGLFNLSVKEGFSFA